METQEQESQMLAAIWTEVESRFAGYDDLAHGWEHTQRVYHLALRLAEQEHANRFIVGMAALLHDLGRSTKDPTRSHAERSAILATTLLAPHDLPLDTRYAILHAILAHSYSRGIAPATLEARVLYDADRLDSLGASGVLRWAMTSTHRRWPETKTYHPQDPFATQRMPDDKHYLLDRFFTKLLTLEKSMTTAAGRAMAQRRTAFLRLYLQEFQRELQEAGLNAKLEEKVSSV
jgi:uncharacterized protein